MSRSIIQTDLLVPTTPVGGWTTALDLNLASLSALDLKAQGDGAFSHDGYSMAFRGAAQCSAAALGATGFAGTANGGALTRGVTLAIRVDTLIEDWIRQRTKFRLSVRVSSGHTLPADSDALEVKFQDNSLALPTECMMVRGFRLASGSYRADASGYDAGAYFSYGAAGAIPVITTLPRWLVADMDDGAILTGWHLGDDPPTTADLDGLRGTKAAGNTGGEQMTLNERWVALGIYQQTATAVPFVYERIVLQYVT
jgi:hypothetical protein